MQSKIGTKTLIVDGPNNGFETVSSDKYWVVEVSTEERFLMTRGANAGML